MNNRYSIKILNQSPFPLPEYQTPGAAGVDLRANLDGKMIIMPHKVYQIPTGIFLEMPIGVEAQIRARSGLALKHGLSLVNGVGTIDADYRGEIKIILINLPAGTRRTDCPDGLLGICQSRFCGSFKRRRIGRQ